MNYEQHIVGALLQRADQLDEVLEVIRPENFVSPNCRIAFAEIIKAVSLGLEPDLPTIAERVRDRVDPVHLTRWMEEAIPSNVLQYAQEQAKRVQTARYLSLAQDIIKRCKTDEPGQIGEALQTGLMELADGPKAKNTALEAVAERYLRWVDDIKTDKIKKLHCHTPGLFDPINRENSIIPYWIGGLSVLISAYTTSGKSAYAVNLAVKEAEAGAKVAIYSNEMGELSYMDRIVGYYADVPYGHVRYNLSEGRDSDRIKSAILRATALPIHVKEPVYSAEEIGRHLRKLQYRFTPDIVVVDYIQNLRPQKNESQYESLSRQGKELIALAKRHDFSLVMVSQIDNQSAREQQGPDNNFMATKGSGDVSADSSIFVELRRNAIDQSKDKHIKMIVRKNRDFGRVGFKDLLFNHTFTRIEEDKSGTH